MRSSHYVHLFMRIIYKLICENYDVEIHKYWWWFQGKRFHWSEKCCWPWICAGFDNITFEHVIERCTERISRSHSSARCKYTNNDCIITRIKSFILMCELHVEAHTKPCRTFNKITPRKTLLCSTFPHLNSKNVLCDYSQSFEAVACPV